MLSFLQSKNLTVGHYYKVTNVVKSSNYLDNFDAIQVEDTISHTETTVDKRNNENEQWVVVGYYEKMKELLVGKTFVYKGFFNKYHSCPLK